MNDRLCDRCCGNCKHFEIIWDAGRDPNKWLGVCSLKEHNEIGGGASVQAVNDFFYDNMTYADEAACARRFEEV